jgi:hypothetical protein
LPGIFFRQPLPEIILSYGNWLCDLINHHYNIEFFKFVFFEHDLKFSGNVFFGFFSDTSNFKYAAGCILREDLIFKLVQESRKSYKKQADEEAFFLFENCEISFANGD